MAKQPLGKKLQSALLQLIGGLLLLCCLPFSVVSILMEYSSTDSQGEVPEPKRAVAAAPTKPKVTPPKPIAPENIAITTTPIVTATEVPHEAKDRVPPALEQASLTSVAIIAGDYFPIVTNAGSKDRGKVSLDGDYWRFTEGDVVSRQPGLDSPQLLLEGEYTVDSTSSSVVVHVQFSQKWPTEFVFRLGIDGEIILVKEVDINREKQTEKNDVFVRRHSPAWERRGQISFNRPPLSEGLDETLVYLLRQPIKMSPAADTSRFPQSIGKVTQFNEGWYFIVHEKVGQNYFVLLFDGKGTSNRGFIPGSSLENESAVQVIMRLRPVDVTKIGAGDSFLSLRGIVPLVPANSSMKRDPRATFQTLQIVPLGSLVEVREVKKMSSDWFFVKVTPPNGDPWAGWINTGALLSPGAVSLEWPTNQVNPGTVLEPQSAASLAPTKDSEQSQAPVKIPRTGNPSRWHQGGNLHGASVAEWRRGTHDNKLATASDFLASTIWKDHLRNPNDLDHIKTKATLLSRALDKIVSGEATDEMKVSEIAAAVITMDPNLGP